MLTDAETSTLSCRYVKLDIDGKLASDNYADRPECGSRVMKNTLASARARGYGYPVDLVPETQSDRLSSGMPSLMLTNVKSMRTYTCVKDAPIGRMMRCTLSRLSRVSSSLKSGANFMSS